MSLQVPITSIVPRLPPAIDGVGDYSLNLAKQLLQDYGLVTEFLAGEPNLAPKAFVDGFVVKHVAERSNAALLDLLPKQNKATVFLHYVGYGYAKRGCPVWLVEGLERWRKAGANRQLITMFHEIYAFGPFWTSQFWTSPLQRNLAARLAKMSTRCFTSRQLYAEILTKYSPDKFDQIPVIPVFSNIGEPNQVRPLSERQKRLIVFGGVGNRLRVYQDSQASVEYACHKLGIEEIWDIGTPTGISLSSIGEVPILQIGELPAQKLSNILADSVAGFLNYNPHFLAKSTIFAAYCAHGLLPISAKGSISVMEGIEPGKHYWVPNLKENGLEDKVSTQAITDNAYDWYQTHNLSVQSRLFASKGLLANID